MKLTPFILFCILLLVLVISSIFGNTILRSFTNVEGFQEGMTTLNSISLPQYSSQHNVFNLYDNIYYDNMNANIIEVTQSVPVESDTNEGNVTVSSTTIVTPRSGQNTAIFDSIQMPTDVPNSQLSNISNSYTAWTQTTLNNYNIFYMPWGLDTYIHIIDGNAKKNIASFGLINGGAMNNYSYPQNSNVGLTGYYSDTDPANMSMVSEPTYNSTREVYQISHFVKYDILNGNLLIQNGDGATKTITTYDINSNSSIINASNQSATSNNKTSLISGSNFQPFTVLDTNGQNLVIYMALQQKVLVALISYADSSLSTYSVNVCRFTANGIDNGNQGLSGQCNSFNKQIENGNPMSDYYRWYWYWNSVGMPNGGGHGNVPGPGTGFPSDDYILKTQIVPPVCPTCPACPATPGTCTNCGGQGGSGTLGGQGSSMLPKDSNGNVSNIGSGTFSSNANPDTIGGSLTLATYDTVAGVEDVAKTGAGVITGVANAGANTITGVANTIGGVGNNVIDSVENVLTSSPNQASGGNVKENNYLKPNQRSIVGPGTQNQYNSANDPYSYYGQLPARGKADFMPVSSDFSRFGR
jgi:hypothetical protein